MAVLTDIGGEDMSGNFPGRRGAIMTTKTGAGYAAVIESRIAPAIGVVTVITGIGTCYMHRIFAAGCRAIVAAETGADHGIVIDADDRYPTIRIVAVVTGIGAGYMGCVFAGSGRAVMAAETGADDGIMIDPGDR